MSKILVILESPGKIAKFQQILGSEYIIKASYGHIEELDKNTLSINVENNFELLYKISLDKKKTVNELMSLAKTCKEVILATDADREGEAIAASLARVLNLKTPKRIIFHEITQKSILKALENPILINENIVNSQQTRVTVDRLVGYKGSPVVWKHVPNAKSVGRVQSIAHKIVYDKEIEINQAISKSYYKTIGLFDEINSVLNYQLQENEIDSFLNLINKKTIIKIVNIEYKQSFRKPSPPFITSTLQQEASTKLHFNSKKTMDIAQKLYENGLITYMRTDSPSISPDASDLLKEYIIENYGDKYSCPFNYSSKNANSQEAHECIRPTNINTTEITLENDYKKLYKLIWNRTVASQMSKAEIQIQLVSIDLLNKISLLTFNDIQHYFISTIENITFQGYLKVYDNTPEDESEKNTGNLLQNKIDDILELTKIKIIEEYTKLPLRYNEAGLIRFLEKKGIGRPSTYSPTISKIIDRKYVEIKNIDGIKKNSKTFELSNKYKIKEICKDVIIGKENNKLTITDMGKEITEFLIDKINFIMNIDFTAQFEELLDKIAHGNANYLNVIHQYYNILNPIVEKLLEKTLENNININTDSLLGMGPNNIEIYIGKGKHGPYIKINEESKWRYISIKDNVNITLEQAITLIEYPKQLGKISNTIVSIHKGPYGYYIKYGAINIPVKDISTINFDMAKELIKNSESKSFKNKNTFYNIKNGEFGNYIQVVSGDKRENVSIPSSYNIENISLNDILTIIENKKKGYTKKFIKK